MKNIFRELVLFLASIGIPSIRFVEKFLSILILSRNFSDIFKVKRYPTRESMWVDGINSFVGNKPLTYLEFGVWEGESILHVSEKFENSKNRFYGFDSFLGLPEIWDTMSGFNSVGHFSTGGTTPKTQDQRVTFIPGWFQNSVDPFISQLDLHDSKLVVHFDADLYSSTLFCLMQIDRLKIPFLAIFDEIPGHETRALYNYIQATGATISFSGRVGPSKNYPWQVMAIISPCTQYIVD